MKIQTCNKISFKNTKYLAAELTICISVIKKSGERICDG